jgi:hypothetical protein
VFPGCSWNGGDGWGLCSNKQKALNFIICKLYLMAGKAQPGSSARHTAWYIVTLSVRSDTGTVARKFSLSLLRKT